VISSTELSSGSGRLHGNAACEVCTNPPLLLPADVLLDRTVTRGPTALSRLLISWRCAGSLQGCR